MMTRLRHYLWDGPKNELLEPYLGQRVRVTVEIEGTFERFYGHEIMIYESGGLTRYVQKRQIAGIELIRRPKMRVQRFNHSRIERVTGFTHAHKNGGGVLKGDSSWRTVNGVFLNTRKHGFVHWEFRRVSGFWR